MSAQLHFFFFFSKHALINEGLRAQSVSPPLPPPSDFAFIKWKKKVSLLSLLPPPFLWPEAQKGARHQPMQVRRLQLWYPKMLRRVVLGVSQQQRPLQTGQGFHFMSCLDCWGRSRRLRSSCQELKSSHLHVFGQCREGKVLTGGAWKKRRWWGECGSGWRSHPCCGTATHPSWCRCAHSVSCWSPPLDVGVGIMWWPQCSWVSKLWEHSEGSFPAQERITGAWFGNGICGLLWLRWRTLFVCRVKWKDM